MEENKNANRIDQVQDAGDSETAQASQAEVVDAEAAAADEQESQDQPANTFPIVGIGASAGGLEAFEKFFTRMPSDSGMAFVLIQHLHPTYKSPLISFFGRWPKISAKKPFALSCPGQAATGP